MPKKFNGVPSSMKVKKDGVEFTDSCDQAMYYLEELILAALKDTGKFIAKRARTKLPSKSGRAKRSLQYWARKRDLDLQVGYKAKKQHARAFYAGYFELGTSKVPKLAPIYSTIQENIEQIKQIQAQYLSALNDPKPNIPVVTGDDTEAEE